MTDVLDFTTRRRVVTEAATKEQDLEKADVLRLLDEIKAEIERGDVEKMILVTLGKPSDTRMGAEWNSVSLNIASELEWLGFAMKTALLPTQSTMQEE